MSERNFEQGIDGEPSKADVITWHLHGFSLLEHPNLIVYNRSYEGASIEEDAFWSAKFLSEAKASHACKVLLA